jgi:pimeloyl-ACP methyl ester carboxylesterase
MANRALAIRVVRWDFCARLVFSSLLMLALVSVPAAAHAQASVTFDLQDGNQAVGFSYGPAHGLGHHDGPLLLMIHGASDTHTVFDFFPGFRAAPELAHLGLNVLALDRVGYGASSHPNGDTLDFATSAGYVHEVIQAVRGGALGYTPTAIVLLGPSAGGDIAIVESGTYHDVDGLIVCSNTSQLQPALFDVDVGAWFAQGDYFDFGVPFRTQFFYAAPFAIPFIVNLDNATRSLVPRAEIQSALGNLSAPFRGQVTAPVLLLQADHDAIFIPIDDSALFSASIDVTFHLLRFTGHKIFEHPASHAPAVIDIATWVGARF